MELKRLTQHKLLKKKKNRIGKESSKPVQGCLAFHFALMPVGRNMNPFLLLGVNSRVDWVL